MQRASFNEIDRPVLPAMHYAENPCSLHFGPGYLGEIARQSAPIACNGDVIYRQLGL